MGDLEWLGSLNVMAHKCQASYEDRAHHIDTTTALQPRHNHITLFVSWCDTTLHLAK